MELLNRRSICTYFCLQEVLVAPDPQEALDPQDLHLVLGILYKYALAPQGLLWGLESQWDHAGLAHKTQKMHCLYRGKQERKTGSNAEMHYSFRTDLIVKAIELNKFCKCVFC